MQVVQNGADNRGSLREDEVGAKIYTSQVGNISRLQQSREVGYDLLFGVSFKWVKL